MSVWIGIVFAVALLAGLALFARRAISVLVVEIVQGRIVRANGRAPGELMRDLGDAVGGARDDGRIALVLEDGGVAVRVTGLGPNAEQRVRNVVGRFPAVRLKTAPRVNVRRALPGKSG